MSKKSLTWRNKQRNVSKRYSFSCHCRRLSVKPFTVFLSLIGLLTACCFTSCTPKTAKITLPLDPPEAFSYSGKAEIHDNWWTAFEDQQLDTMLSYALDSNFNLLIAWQRFQAAEAVFERESSFLLPDVEASLRGGANYPEPDFVGGENLRFGLSSVYELDLWGRIRSRIEAERYRAAASFFDYQAAEISLSAEIARNWYQLMAAWQQLAIIEEQIDTNEKILRLLRARFGSGQIRAVDILRQKQLLEASREQRISAEARIQLIEHQLAALSGIPPQRGADYFPDSLPELPPLPHTGIPAELVRRRPDVQAAFLLLKAADRQLAAAISNQYPRFTISGSVSVRANNVEDLFQDWAYSLAGNLAAPLFYGGRLRAEVDRSQAIKKQRLYEWGQTVLIAFREVEDALIQERKQVETIEVLEEQLILADQAYEQLRLQYFNGLTDYLDVLTALDQEQELRRDLISAKLQLLEFRISLYRALAGGFEMEREG